MGNKPLVNDELLPGGVAKGDRTLGFMSAGWTNERHSTYISSMEASFVNQLYGLENHRIDAKSSHLGGNGLKVVRDGVCNNIRFEGPDARMHDELASGQPDKLLIKRHRPRNAGLNLHVDWAEVSVDDYGSGTDTVRERVRFHGREVNGLAEENLIEVSDQNFPEEEVDVEANDEPHKRMRPTSSAVPNDQPA